MPLNVETYCLDGQVVYENVGRGALASLSHENEIGAYNTVIFGCDEDDTGSDIFLVEDLEKPLTAKDLLDWEEYCTDDNQILYLPNGFRRPMVAEELGFKNPSQYQMVVASHIQSWFPVLFKIEGRPLEIPRQYNSRGDCI